MANFEKKKGGGEGKKADFVGQIDVIVSYGMI
jgi:hypothetical protein